MREVPCPGCQGARLKPISLAVTLGGKSIAEVAGLPIGECALFLADLENKKAVFQPATVGIIEGDRAEIVEPAGLTGQVITLGHHLLENGTALILPESAPGAGGPAPKKKAPGDKR